MSARYEFAEMEFQNSGFCSGEPYCSTNVERHEPGRGDESGDAPVPRRQLYKRSG